MENKISKVTKKDILLGLISQNIDIEKIISEVFDFNSKETTDGRYENMMEDWYQHRINNSDWEADRFITDSRLNILNLSDQDFLQMLCDIIHPEKISDVGIVLKIIDFMKSKLRRDGFELVVDSNISGRPTYKGKAISIDGKSNIQFYCISYGEYKRIIKDLPTKYKSPCVLLVSDSRNDFGYHTLYKSYICFDTKDSVEIGYVKILQEGKDPTELPDDFIQLPDTFCSLFQSIEIYRKLSSPEIVKYNILHQLNDLRKLCKINLQSFLKGFSVKLSRIRDRLRFHANMPLFYIKSVAQYGIKPMNALTSLQVMASLNLQRLEKWIAFEERLGDNAPPMRGTLDEMKEYHALAKTIFDIQKELGIANAVNNSMDITDGEEVEDKDEKVSKEFKRFMEKSAANMDDETFSKTFGFDKLMP